MVLGLVCPQASFATTTASASLSPASIATLSQQDLSSSEDSVGLPTLLASRLTAVGHAPDATKKRGRVLPTLVTEQLPSAADQDIRCIVRNTFIEYRGIDLMSPLAEGNRRTREPMTCPASRVGRMNSLFEDTPNTIEFAPLEDIPPSPLPWRETPKTPSPEGALLAAAGQSSLSGDAAVFVPGLCQHYGEAAAAAGSRLVLQRDLAWWPARRISWAHRRPHAQHLSRRICLQLAPTSMSRVTADRAPSCTRKAVRMVCAARSATSVSPVRRNAGRRSGRPSQTS